MEPDASGWATKADILCADGRTIRPDAFKHQDQKQVPLVYMHNHDDPENVLGHALLTNKPEGVWVDLFFNNTPKGQHSKEAVNHKDITQMSIYADRLIEHGKVVSHGTIREVSLVLAGANPGALIQSAILDHGDGNYEELPDQAVITTGLDMLTHSAADGTPPPVEKTAQDVYDTLDEDQLKLVHLMLGEAVDAATSAQHDAGDGTNPDNKLQHDAGDGKKEGPSVEKNDANNVIKHNVFEKKDATIGGSGTLMHKMAGDQVKGLIKHGFKTRGMMSELVHGWIESNGDTLEHGIENLDVLFPEARALTATPTWDKRRTEWVATVLNGVRQNPFSRIKSWTADITYEGARAKGYITGNMKKEEFFSIAKRETGPTTFYKKQKFDRDDIIDITDFDLISWVKGEMRLMLEEEFARAILLGDGRDVEDEDKIPEDKIRPIATDLPYYTNTVTVDNTDVLTLIDTMIIEREQYNGTGQPTFFTTQRWLGRALTKRNDLDQKLYQNKAELAADMDVAAIVIVPVMVDYPTIIGVLVNLDDYSVGTDQGGQVTLFDDFDIDFNKYTYLIEGRSSGALREPHTAQVFKVQAGAAVTATKPAFDEETFTLTIPTISGVTYKDADGNTISAGTHVLDAGDVLRVIAWPNTGKFLTNGLREWSYMRPTGS